MAVSHNWWLHTAAAAAVGVREMAGSQWGV